MKTMIQMTQVDRSIQKYKVNIYKEKVKEDKENR